MFDVKQSVENKSDKPVTLYPWSLVVRYGEPPAEGIYILHEGPYGVFNGSLKEFGYSDFKDNKQQKISDHRRLGRHHRQVLDGDPGARPEGEGRRHDQGRPARAPTSSTRSTTSRRAQAIAPGATAATDAHLFAGAKIVRVIDDYAKKLRHRQASTSRSTGAGSGSSPSRCSGCSSGSTCMLGNFGLSILVLTVIVKAVFFPLANKSYAAMSKMKALQPEMEKLKERYGEDRQRMNQELMQLYRREKVNPAAGCLPILVQIPVFFALYKVLYTTIEMRHQPFFGWIKDLAAPDPLTILTGFGLFQWHVPEFLHFFNIGIWPIIMGVTMYLQQKLNPQPTDPVQARVFQFLPILFTFMLAPFAAGLVIYWAWSNTLSIAQQYTIMRRHGTPIGGGKAKPAVAAARRRRHPRRHRHGSSGGGGGKKGGKGAQEALMDEQADARRRRSRRRASSSPAPASSWPGRRRSSRCSRSRCPRSPSPAAPMSASRAWSTR